MWIRRRPAEFVEFRISKQQKYEDEFGLMISATDLSCSSLYRPYFSVTASLCVPTKDGQNNKITIDIKA